jgi:hypothetical protein
LVALNARKCFWVAEEDLIAKVFQKREGERNFYKKLFTGDNKQSLRDINLAKTRILKQNNKIVYQISSLHN